MAGALAQKHARNVARLFEAEKHHALLNEFQRRLTSILLIL
jgi:hypothetical protein